MGDVMSEALLAELAGPVEKLIDRHLSVAHEWYAYEHTPWSEARDFTDAAPWSPDDYPLPDGVRSALFVHLLTEDNLPYYTSTILAQSGPEHPLNRWTKRWTSEEGQHSIVIRDWIITTRAYDPRKLEQGRTVQVAEGQVPQPDTLPDMLAYTSFQEEATRVAHSNTGRKLGKERGGAHVMALVAGDEALHYRFYRDAVVAALDIDPSAMVIAIHKQLRNFAMPGTGIPDFGKHSEAIAREGIYNGRQHLEVVVKPTLEHWEIDEVEGLSDDAKIARDGIHKWLRVLERAASGQERKFEKEASLSNA